MFKEVCCNKLYVHKIWKWGSMSEGK